MSAASITPSPGRIIMIDGPDGAGKTTQLGLLGERLQEQGYHVYSSRVNGGTPIGEALRTVYLDPALSRPPETDLYIMLGMHAALARELLERRAAGEICLVDRSPLSIIAYQVYGSGLDRHLGETATKESLKLFDPDLIICYQAPLEVLQAHRAGRRKHANNNYFENQPLDYIQRVIAGYEAAAKLHNTVQTVSTAGSIAEAQAATWELLQPLLPVDVSSHSSGQPG